MSTVTMETTSRSDLSHDASHPVQSKMLEYGFVKEGGPYDANQGFFEMKLPQSVYTALFMGPLIISNDQICGTDLFTQIVPYILTFILSIGVQFVFIYYIEQIVAEKDLDDRCVAGDAMIRGICLMIFIAAVMMDVAETIYMHQYVNQFPNWNEERDGPILEQCHNESGLTNLPLQSYKNEQEYPGLELVKPAVGITRRYRLFIYVILALKVAIALLLLYLGSAHLLSADSQEELILNTVAVVFIFEIDELIFNSCTSPMAKFWIETGSTLTRCEDEDTCIEMFTFYIWLVIYVPLCFCIYTLWC